MLNSAKIKLMTDHSATGSSATALNEMVVNIMDIGQKENRKFGYWLVSIAINHTVKQIQCQMFPVGRAPARSRSVAHGLFLT
jgi:hypothetical protein